MKALSELSAHKVLELLEREAISPCELLTELESHVKQIEPQINALPIVDFARAHQQAQQLMQRPLKQRGLLQGLPVAIKDLVNVQGLRTTYGSLVFRDNIATRSDFLVRNLQDNGALVYAKSNTPEFGAGGNTFNAVFGATRNPYDLTRSAGGSSGGAAAALASGGAWLAHGSDLAGSLRTPASFCGVCSLRPSPGLIADGSSDMPFQVLAQDGPMARDIHDLALFTDAMTGVCHSAGISKAAPDIPFREIIKKPLKPKTIAYSPDLGLVQTCDEVQEIFEKTIAIISQCGIITNPAHPQLPQLDLVFDTPRALDYAHLLQQIPEQQQGLIKAEVRCNAAQADTFDLNSVREAQLAQGRLFNSATSFMADYDLLLCPATIIPANSINERYVGVNDAIPTTDYFRWLKIAYAITATTLPVITLPMGKTCTGLPVGLQLVGKAHGESELFAFASFLEKQLNWDSRPVSINSNAG